MTIHKNENSNDFSKGYGDIDKVESDNKTIPTMPSENSEKPINPPLVDK